MKWRGWWIFWKNAYVSILVRGRMLTNSSIMNLFLGIRKNFRSMERRMVRAHVKIIILIKDTVLFFEEFVCDKIYIIRVIN